MSHQELPLLLATSLLACHLGYLSPTGEGPREGDTDIDVDTDASCDASLAERGDDQQDADELGSVDPPLILCADLRSVSNDGGAYTGDYDWVFFEASGSGVWSFALSWDQAEADYDLFLLDGGGSPLAGANTRGEQQPERLDYVVADQQSYGLVVVGWSGEPGSYQLSIQ